MDKKHTAKTDPLWQRLRAGESLSEGDALEVLDRLGCGVWPKLPDGFLNEPSEGIRQITLAFVLGFKAKTGGYPLADDFREARLRGILGFYNYSPYDAFIDTGFTNPACSHYDKKLASAPWRVLKQVSRSYWHLWVNRAKCVLYEEDELGRLPQARELPSQLIARAGGLEHALAEAAL
jgi:hypothetical protein